MKTHRTDGVSLTFALVFLSLVSWWYVARLVDLELPKIGWFIAAALIISGLLGLLGAVRAGRHERPNGDRAAGKPEVDQRPTEPIPAVVDDDAG